jgi:hypothetical protein
MKELNNVFNLEVTEALPETPIVSAEIISQNQTDDNDVSDDYNLARNTLRNVIEKGARALDDVVSLAASSEHPRSYEVAGQIMKTLADVSKDLLELQKQKRDIIKPLPSEKPKITQQNNIVFTGSTSDLMKAIKDNTEKLIDESSSN